MFKQIKGAAQLRHVAGKVAYRQQVALACDDDFVLCAADCFGGGGYGGLHEGGDFAAQGFYFGLQARGDLLKRHAAKVGVEVVGGFGELARGKVAFGKKHAVLHIAFGRDDDDEDALFRQAQKFDVPEC